MAAAVFMPIVLILLRPVGALADEPAYRTVFDGLVPKTAGLTITGSPGGCDLVIENITGQDVIFLDKAGKPTRFVAPQKPPAPPLDQAVHLTGAWPCASLPAITEDEQWNHQQVTLLSWSLTGQVGATAFKLQAHTDYDPTLDPLSEWMLYLRIGAGVAAAGGLLLGVPYLLQRRRQILAPPA